MAIDKKTIILGAVIAAPFAMAAASGAAGTAILTTGAANAAHGVGAVANVGGELLASGGQWAMTL
jgi:hypothetical protein